MLYLWIVTFLWAFSFSLIGVYLAGEVDGYIAVFIRMALALVLFLPFLRKPPHQVTMFKLMMIGAVQIGLMYLFFYHSFLYLSVAEVLLFTILTPVYVSLFDRLIARNKVGLFWLVPAVLAVIGAAVIRYQPLTSDFAIGLLLVQAANICFALGQVCYKRLSLPAQQPIHQHFAYFFLGATLIALPSALWLGDWQKLPTTTLQWSVLIWLGLGASGLGYALWNAGAKKVNTEQLATMNNMLIPAGLLVNFLIWDREADWVRLLIGGSIIVLSVMLAQSTLFARQKN
ncbi:carboxylate/amino acid/amine transporter [Pleionea sp. CnH1-48]|uniref:carboxylate/amino acid/amine transporter n=1 Tax=Pleionea sp. CnH1-48 TaxID=2954494 RepID=UPI00209812C2|nr:carboxylate/amino acid/amine transporter [Pleionea sp. CnH1-48]MCO7225123.1 carboxylate/amino acid/amine transporter [Pleionea sp. CnH1-48]